VPAGTGSRGRDTSGNGSFFAWWRAGLHFQLRLPCHQAVLPAEPPEQEGTSPEAGSPSQLGCAALAFPQERNLSSRRQSAGFPTGMLKFSLCGHLARAFLLPSTVTQITSFSRHDPTVCCIQPKRQGEIQTQCNKATGICLS